MDIGILYAGLSAVTGVELITPSEAAARNIRSEPISIDKVFKYIYKREKTTFQLYLKHPPSEWININVTTTTGAANVISVHVKNSYTIAQVKEAIEKKCKFLPADSQRLVFQMRLLPDEETIQSIGIKEGDTIEDVSDHPKGEWIDINIETKTGVVIRAHVHKDDTIAQIKEAIEKNYENLPADCQRLIFNKWQLSDKKTVQDNGIKDGDTLFLTITVRGGAPGGGGLPIVLNDNFLDHQFSYDFRGQRDDGKVYMRGGEVYHRPYGWYRFALKVLDKYGDNTWLGEDGIRTESTPGEWTVSYHGTTREGAEGIATQGYDVNRGTRFAFGRGIYSAPDLSIVERDYAKQFSKNGRRYKIVFQNRVNPVNLRKVNYDQYWLVADDSDIRPYGILVKDIDARGSDDCRIL